MFIISDKKNPKKHGLIWDSKNKKPLIKFNLGKAVTDDKAIADKLKQMGYDVVEKKDKEVNDEEVNDEEVKG